MVLTLLDNSSEALRNVSGRWWCLRFACILKYRRNDVVLGRRGFASVIGYHVMGSIIWWYFGSLYVDLDWLVRVFGSYGLMDITYERFSILDIPRYVCMDRLTHCTLTKLDNFYQPKPNKSKNTGVLQTSIVHYLARDYLVFYFLGTLKCLCKP